MRCCERMLFIVGLLAICAVAPGQDAKKIVAQSVHAELAADDADHSRWIYFEVDRKPDSSVKQWVAETGCGDLHRVVDENGNRLSEREQRSRIDAFARNDATQAKQRKSDEHDDQQAREMLKMLPEAFVWTRLSDQGGKTVLHFRPDPNFHPPSYQARVFAAMEGEMTVDDAEHRIASLKGRMIHDVTFGFGILGDLKAGGSFNVERRQVAPGIWQITETHVHIQGRALLFKSISDQEDDVKSQFQQITGNPSVASTEQRLMGQHT